MSDDGGTRREPARVALVLSGGGAHGAYEAGVLSHLLHDIAPRLGRWVHFDIVTGTSVGAVHACYVAASQEADDAGTRLLDIWRSLSLGRVFDPGARDLFRVPWRLVGLGSAPKSLTAHGGIPERLPGLVDTTWLEEIVLDSIRWEQIRRNVDEGRVRSVALFYASANRDEEVFADPFVFRTDRDPNPHLGFGVGEHFCLGAHLARLDLKVLFRQFVERIEHIEFAAPVQPLHASFVGGPKHVPIRYRMTPARRM